MPTKVSDLKARKATVKVRKTRVQKNKSSKPLKNVVAKKVSRKTHLRKRNIVQCYDDKGITSARLTVMRAGKTLYDIYPETDKLIAIMDTEEKVIYIEPFVEVPVTDKDAPYNVDHIPALFGDRVFTNESPSALTSSFNMAESNELMLLLYSNYEELELYGYEIRHSIDYSDE